MLAEDALDGRLDRCRFLDAALVVSGVSSADRRRALIGRFDRWCADLAPRVRGTPPEVLARALLHALHDRWCQGGFDATCAHLDATLERGRYNCITTVILYGAAARRMGLSPVWVAVPGHVYLELPTLAQPEVQTTCPTWLDEGVPKPRVPGGTPRTIGDLQLLAKLVYNQGLAALARGQYDKAAARFQKALLWDPQDRAASQNLIASYNNGALVLCQRGQDASAQAAIRAAQRLDPRLHLLQSNAAYIRRQAERRRAAAGGAAVRKARSVSRAARERTDP